MTCENCGSTNIREQEIEGYRVAECQVCGHLHGNDEAITKITQVREAREMAIDPIIYPLYKRLQTINHFKVQYACPGYPQEKVPPYISFHVTDGGNKFLEKFTQALIEANKSLKVHWMVEVTFQKQLIFILKPDFHHDPYQISAEQISMAQRDIEVLNQMFEDKVTE